ncbi:lipid A ethanolaminephosphotransferase [Tepidimonas ignava]|uniref:Lipid A ethanolaminephosphotransferase n=1 Tax=Tepidimonas ignava TaxID=114249 RepID=A0A4R3LHA7_9BURK|nr:phosphoethanolamine--lipid A transferase [Tepidimonas ignava]TCS99509.1 lipid A ethanolaminephosphotransferase [Tepidimonas ignava]TSE22009.1 Phosphoethanolamine transferase EptA [Tepidimonas ignava]
MTRVTDDNERNAKWPGGQRWEPLVALALWMALVGNVPLWAAVLQRMEGGGWRPWLVTAAWMGALAAVNLAVLALLAVGPLRRPLGLVLLALVAVPSYFMLAYGIVIDSSMVANVFNTDAREAADLVTPALLVVAVLGVALPGWLWWRLPVAPAPWRRALGQRGGLAMGALALAALLLWLTFQDLAALMRTERTLRYMINPYNSIYATLRHGLGRHALAAGPVQPLDDQVPVLPAHAREDDAPLLVLVVGETARAANVSLGGYTRDTTPRLAALQRAGELVYFADTTSCGTNTQTSVPCMFAPDGRQRYDPARAQENLLDVVQRAGLAVTWLDNQSGCKGVCARVPTLATDRLQVPGLCSGDECHDEVLLRELPGTLQTLDAQRRRVGTLAVLHMMGSHGPAYHKRTPAAFKRFEPECTSAQLQTCPREHIVNAYDNTIAYTDHVLGELVAWLAQRRGPAALLYVSDHGESLGEGGLYLHGMPYALAPREQTHVPMALWLNGTMRQRLQLDMACLQRRAAEPASHDHLFHTVAGLLGVRTRVYDAERDLLRTCRRG